MVNTSYFKKRFEQNQNHAPDDTIGNIRQEAFNTFNKAGLPTIRHEEWKYTAVSNLFDKEYQQFSGDSSKPDFSMSDVDAIRLPGHLHANELVFVNGIYTPALSTIRSSALQLTVLPLEDAAKGIYKKMIAEHLGHSSLYIKDGIHALNTSFIYGGVFIHVYKGQELKHPIYLYHLSNVQQHHTLSQPRSLIYADEETKLRVVETYLTIGTMDSFSNQVMELVVQNNAHVEYYKIQNDVPNASQVSTTHIRQTGKSYVHALTVTLSGNIIRNNMNIVLEASGSEAHLYGLYYLKGHTHTDNHTLVDNVKPNCFSNELYKGILDDHATAVFNGKIMVQPHAQKINAYQSNKNILLSDYAGMNTKPQLEIFANDVKCSHGCTVGQLDENALFYLRSKGIPEETARTMLLQAFAADVLMQIKPDPLRAYVEKLINLVR